MAELDGISQILDTHFEWLAVRENGRTLPLRRDEIEIEESPDRTLIGFVDDGGFSFRRIAEHSFDGAEAVLVLAGPFGSSGETLRLIPREPAAQLSENIRLARLRRANEVASIMLQSVAGSSPIRVSLNEPNGRIANILLRNADGTIAAVAADVSSTLTAPSLAAAGLKWFERVSTRKKDRPTELWFAAERRPAIELRRLSAMLKPAVRNSIRVFSIDPSKDPPSAKTMSEATLSDLWRERPPKLKIPAEIVSSNTARRVIALDEQNIDVVFSNQGETLRFNGLPFARVRKLMGRERAWFGAEKRQNELNDLSWPGLIVLLEELRTVRTAETTNARHKNYLAASEAWLESILRRNIKLLDANLELSPIYNQFRFARDRIDLLAIRRDGRLVLIELKTQPDRGSVLQAASYWRRIELQRRKGILNAARLFGDKVIADRPTLVYCVAPALSFHHDFEFFARMLSPEIELWRWELHQDWRREIKVISRVQY